MIDTVYSFFIPSLIVIKILIATYLLALKFERRKFFWVRFIGFGLTAVILIVWAEVVFVLLSGQGFQYGAATEDIFQSVFNLIFYLAIFVMTIIVTVLSYKESLPRVLLFCSGAYAAQHIASNISVLLGLLPIFNGTGILRILIDFITYIAVCAAIYFLFARRSTYETYKGNNGQKVMLSLIVIIVCIVVSRLTSDNPQRNNISIIAESLLAVISCGVLLISQFGVVKNDSMHSEVASMTELLRSERRQYDLSRENIKLINEKCHDLKHQISALRKNASEESIAEIEQAVIIYDSMVKTGHDVLDVILTEKKLQCERNRIHMTCMIKGELVSFIDNMDVYSLFGNALSNAIESVSRVADEQKRCIGINVKNVGSLLSIHIENFYDGEIVLKDGLPVTTKDDKDYHGFGMASMRRIARKYGGEMTLSVGNNKFNLDFLIPIPA